MGKPVQDWRVVLQISTDSADECLRFAGIPMVDPVQLSIWAPPGDAAGAKNAKTLFHALRQAIFSIVHPPGSKPFTCGYSRRDRCMARDETRCRSLLIVVSGGAQPISHHKTMLDDWVVRPNSRILPVLPHGTQPASILPSPHDQAGVLFHAGGVQGVVPNVLNASGIVDDEFRLFISYVRRDTEPLVDEIHDAFVHQGWHVYVDRFRGAPGRRFPYQIAEELMGMGCILLIESAGVPRSNWTQYEIGFALQYRLGILAAQLPGAPTEASIPSGDRMKLSGSKPSQAEIDALVNFVGQRYAPQRLRRALYLELLWTAALIGVGVKSTTDTTGVRYNKLQAKGGAKREAAVVLARRATDVGDFRRIADCHRGDRHFAIGAADLHPPAHRANVSWLARTLSVALRTEDEAADLAHDMRGGRV